MAHAWPRAGKGGWTGRGDERGGCRIITGGKREDERGRKARETQGCLGEDIINDGCISGG